MDSTKDDDMDSTKDDDMDSTKDDDMDSVIDLLRLPFYVGFHSDVALC